MAGILDDLGKKISEAGKTTIQKTREISSVNKLNSAIAAEERTQESLYAQLGREYYEAHADTETVGDPLSDIVKDIRESRERVEELQSEINDIRGIRICPECGSDVTLGAIYCNICGIKMPEYEAAEREGKPVTERCTGCGSKIKPVDKFCPVCGTKVERREEEVVEDAETISSPAETADDAPRDPDAEVVSGEVVDHEDHTDV